MRKISQIMIIIGLSIFGSCIDPLDVNIDKEVKVLIVEGAITTKPGPYYIKLTKSAKYGSIFDGYIQPVSGANVTIRDSNGTVVKLIEDKVNRAPGIYATPPSFRAEVGLSYTLLITTNNGIEYTSLPEKIRKAPGIIKLTPEFKKSAVGGNQFETGLVVNAEFQDNPEERDYYMWKNNGTYKIITHPENFILISPPAPPTPAPKDCCEQCWVNEVTDHTIRLLADNNVNGNLITDAAAFIEDDGVRYTEKYLIRIEQHSLSREAFTFFQLLKEQLSINGGIFDPPPATIRGNMINLSNPDENVIGYFRASDVAIDSIFLTRDMLEPKVLVSLDDDCQAFRNGKTEQPVYW